MTTLFAVHLLSILQLHLKPWRKAYMKNLWKSLFTCSMSINQVLN